jgi:hypothetical protein
VGGTCKVKLSPNRPWRPIGVSCDVRTSSTYRKVKLSPNRPWRSVGVSCEARTSSTYNKVKLSPNRPWRSVGVFPVTYEHHLHIQK